MHTVEDRRVQPGLGHAAPLEQRRRHVPREHVDDATAVDDHDVVHDDHDDDHRTTSSSTTSTTTSTTTTSTTTTTTAPPAGGRFETLPVGATLPSDATCAALVRDAPEIRPANATFNQTRGQQNPALPGYYGRVTGNFVGTTDEIIQWAACKWGIDEDIVRAQTAKESWWFQRSGGDFTLRPDAVRPRPPDRRRRPARAVPRVDRRAAGALPVLGLGVPARHDLDGLQPRRGDGRPAELLRRHETWLNTVERGREYVAGDLWGCVGTWFSGRWYTQPSLTYIADGAGLPRPAHLGAPGVHRRHLTGNGGA